MCQFANYTVKCIYHIIINTVQSGSFPYFYGLNWNIVHSIQWYWLVITSTSALESSEWSHKYHEDTIIYFYPKRNVCIYLPTNVRLQLVWEVVRVVKETVCICVYYYLLQELLNQFRYGLHGYFRAGSAVDLRPIFWSKQ